MRLKKLFPEALLLLTLAVAMLTYNMAEQRLARLYEPEWEEFPEYTYLSPYVELSPYDHYFREAADSLGYDWKLLAAIAFTESRFDSNAVSKIGAKGVMQIMPITYRNFNIPDSLHDDNYTNIMAATMLLQSLENSFNEIEDPEQRLKFVLASYNAGYGHVCDARRLARKYGYNSHVWDANVDSFLIHKKDYEYYKDSVCKHGRFKGWRETLPFVKKVHSKWRSFSSAQQSYSDSIRTAIANGSTIRIKQ